MVIPIPHPSGAQEREGGQPPFLRREGDASWLRVLLQAKRSGSLFLLCSFLPRWVAHRANLARCPQSRVSTTNLSAIALAFRQQKGMLARSKESDLT
jgi:hypothetical protein